MIRGAADAPADRPARNADLGRQFELAQAGPDRCLFPEQVDDREAGRASRLPVRGLGEDRGESVAGKTGDVAAVIVDRVDHRAEDAVYEAGQDLRALLALGHQPLGERREARDIQEQARGLELTGEFILLEPVVDESRDQVRRHNSLKYRVF